MSVTLTKTQKARAKWLENLGLSIGHHFEVAEDGVFIYGLDEFLPWNGFAKKSDRDDLAGLIATLGLAGPVEYDTETLSALNEDHILGLLNPHIGSAGEDEEILSELICAQLAAQVEQVLDEMTGEELEILPEVAAKVEAEVAAEAATVILEPAAEQEEMAFVITTKGVELSKAFRKAIAARAKNYFEVCDTGTNIAGRIQEDCLAGWGEVTRTRQRGAYAAYRYAAAIVRSLEAQARNGTGLRVNSYWA